MVLLMFNLFANAQTKPDVVDPDSGGIGQVGTKDLNRTINPADPYASTAGVGSAAPKVEGKTQDCLKRDAQGRCVASPNKSNIANVKGANKPKGKTTPAAGTTTKSVNQTE